MPTGPSTGYVLFSDVVANTIYAWQPDGRGVREFLSPSGTETWAAAAGWIEPGSNGLVFVPGTDADGHPQVVVMEHGSRRVCLLDINTRTRRVLATHFEGRRINSPNDGAFRPGTRELYFSDPPYGFQQRHFPYANLEFHPDKELDFSGLFRLALPVADDAPPFPVEVMVRNLYRPNGVAFFPDGNRLLVSNPQGWWIFNVSSDGQLSNQLPFGPRRLPGSEPIDGIAIHPSGRFVFATAPGGVHILDAHGQPLGRIVTNMRNGNVVIGSDDFLYICADFYLMRLPLRKQH